MSASANVSRNYSINKQKDYAIKNKQKNAFYSVNMPGMLVIYTKKLIN